jgi:hypothetical protein
VEIDDIETGDSTCHLQRQVGEPKYIPGTYTSPKYQATKYEAETANSTVLQPRCPSEDIYETRVLKHKSETHTLTADATTTSRNRPVPELTPVHKAYKLALSQEPVTNNATEEACCLGQYQKPTDCPSEVY